MERRYFTLPGKNNCSWILIPILTNSKYDQFQKYILSISIEGMETINIKVETKDNLDVLEFSEREEINFNDIVNDCEKMVTNLVGETNYIGAL